ncbi:hypothetical protein RM780_07705 [Streptomyces sp. DSM 44917]|uniref:Uncharacterized protein n=1 Tax=Streptomyces boetiae TaxID=3075541 RepID=A0ABU2L658_9ACTN|nr:hypothetical protein [Streptomyces sp. DSM 44917]MDT0306847.1 hypothetical protein [Streptomyces sp. DSM 44917]
MSPVTHPDDGTGRPAPGSVPHAWRNALFWRWAPALPRPLRDGFLKILQAAGAAANAAGQLRFSDTGRPIRLRDLAGAACVDEKDARRYLAAAVEAGVMAVEGGRGRGRSTLYALVMTLHPDWDAAAEALRSTRRAPRKPPPWTEENGGPAPEPTPGPGDGSSGDTPPNQNGGHTPEPEPVGADEVRGTHPRPGSGDTPPTGSGDTPPNIPGVPRETPHDEVSVGPQPPTAPGPAVPPAPAESPPPPAADAPAASPGAPTRCPGCGGALIALAGRTPRAVCGACSRTSTPRPRPRPGRRRTPRTA